MSWKIFRSDPQALRPSKTKGDAVADAPAELEAPPQRFGSSLESVYTQPTAIVPHSCYVAGGEVPAKSRFENSAEYTERVTLSQLIDSPIPAKSEESREEFSARLAACKEAGISIPAKANDEDADAFQARLEKTVEAGVGFFPKGAHEEGVDHSIRVDASLRSGIALKPRSSEESAELFARRMKLSVELDQPVSPPAEGEWDFFYGLRLDATESLGKVIPPPSAAELREEELPLIQERIFHTTESGLVIPPMNDVESPMDFRDRLTTSTQVGRVIEPREPIETDAQFWDRCTRALQGE